MSGTLIEIIKDFQQKNEIWQWDVGRQIKITPVENAIVDEVHFSNAYSKDALVVKPQVNTQGNIVADIPNILLWQVFPINVYVVMEFPNGKGTIYEEQLKINSRKKPSDYVYTETEVRNYEALEERIKALEENGTGGGGGITKETDPTVPEWAKQPTKPSYTADEVGAASKDEFDKFVLKHEEEFDKLSEDIADLKQNGTGSGSGATTAQANSLWAIIQKSAFVQQLTDAEINDFKTAWGIGVEVEPDIPDEPIEPDNSEITLTSISATYTGGEVAVGTSVNSLTGITVTAHYSDGTSKTVSGYTLSGTIAEGNNTITVSYGGKTTTITVTGVRESSGETIDTSPVIEQYGYALTTKETPIAKEWACYTVAYPVDGVGKDINFIHCIPNIDNVSIAANLKLHRLMDGVYGNYESLNSAIYNEDKQEYKARATNTYGDFNSVKFTLFQNTVEDSYAYVLETGEILFAGKNTEYYGMKNISEATA